MSENNLLKNILNPNLVQIIGKNIESVHPQFRVGEFNSKAISSLDTLSLKDRARHIAVAMNDFLPRNYPNAIEILMETMKIPIRDEENLGKYPEFYFLPFAEFIAAYGGDYFNESMEANYQLTKVFTAEFSVRVFIEKYPERSLRILNSWAEDKDHHVRRLVSEGTRPRLPWASRLLGFQKDPTPVLKLLEKLKSDPELYVRRSVANNLNDIAKDHPDLVIKTLKRWKESGHEHTDWIVRHASRTLIKSGHKEALILQGFDPNVKVSLQNFKATALVMFGQKFDFSFDLINQDSESKQLVVDFVIYFKKANGSLAPKVFKLSERAIKNGETISFSKSHPIRPISTRKYYNGQQRLTVQVNGRELGSVEFELVGVS